MKPFHINKTVTRNFFMDIVANVQNMLGLNQTSYEKMVDRAMKLIMTEMKRREIDPEWYRFEITQLGRGALSITVYGEGKE